VDVSVLRADDLVKHYPVRGSDRPVRAVQGVSIELGRGETLGIAGESGCGKSTLARLLVGLEVPDGGSVEVGAARLGAGARVPRRAMARSIQLVFQDPYASLNPRKTVAATLAEVLAVHGLAGDRSARRRRAEQLLAMVGLRPAFAERYPHELSGGQRQRIGIARALAAEPAILVLDEPVSALDVSVRAEVMNLLVGLRDRLGLSFVFISHDLSMVRQISDRVAIMYLGRVVEQGPWQAVLDDPRHPYTSALQAAVPVADPELDAQRTVITLPGEVADPANPPPGCPFHPRCPLAEDVCRARRPPLEELAPRHLAACHVAARAAGSRCSSSSSSSAA
jgi:oligopeptide/dipeptide ABC transporter ATP-binding protein